MDDQIMSIAIETWCHDNGIDSVCNGNGNDEGNGDGSRLSVQRRGLINPLLFIPGPYYTKNILNTLLFVVAVVL